MTNVDCIQRSLPKQISPHAQSRPKAVSHLRRNKFRRNFYFVATNARFGAAALAESDERLIQPRSERCRLYKNARSGAAQLFRPRERPLSEPAGNTFGITHALTRSVFKKWARFLARPGGGKKGLCRGSQNRRPQKDDNGAISRIDVLPATSQLVKRTIDTLWRQQLKTF
jgi:hypothetical protein